MARRRKKPRSAEPQLWATRMCDPELAKDSAEMVAALQRVAATIEPRPDPLPAEQFIGRLRQWADRLGSESVE